MQTRIAKIKTYLRSLNLRSPRVIAIALLLLLIPLTFLIFFLNSSNDSSQESAGWQTYEEQVKEGKIKPAGKILEIVMEYNSVNAQPLTIKEISKKNGYVATVIPEDSTFRMQLLSSRNVVIAQQYFSIPSIARVESFDKDGTIHGEDLNLENVSFAVTLPWKDNVSRIVVVDGAGEQIFTSGTFQVKEVNNKPEFSSIGGDEFMEMQKKKLNFMDNKAYAQDVSEKVDIAFIGNGIADMNTFRQHVERFANNLMSYEPFSSRASQLNFHIVENTDDLQCQNYGSRGVVCDESIISQRINSAGVPHDVVAVIINSSEPRAAATNMAFASSAVRDDVMTHELGHALGKLIDEYAYDGESKDGPLSNEVYRLGRFDNATKTAPLIPGEGNCFAGSPPASAWNGTVAEGDYRKRCLFLNWYASSQTSIMHAAEDGSLFFNTVSQRILNRRLDILVAGGNPELGPGADVYAVNRNGASGKTEVHALSGALNFKDFSIHAATGLHQTVGNEWSFALGSFYDEDYISDIYAINRNGANGKTEVHVLSGKSNFSDFALHAVTGLETTTGDNWVFDVGNGPDDDPRADLFAINKQGGSGKTEVHILQGGPEKDYKDFSLHAESGLHATDKNWDFVIGWFSDNANASSDIYAINRNGASGKTEVHVLSAESEYKDFSLHAETALHATDNADWSFTTGFFDNDLKSDLYAINRNGGSGKTEVHILSAASDFKEFILHSVSGLAPTNNTNWTFAPSQDYVGASGPDPNPQDPVNPDPKDPVDPDPGQQDTDPVDQVNPNPQDPVDPNPVDPDPIDPNPQDPTNPDPVNPDDPPPFVCGGSPDNICTSPTVTIPPIDPGQEDCLDSRGTTEKINDWVNNFIRKIQNYIREAMGNPQQPPPPPIPCILQ